jgi:hypothetical protein
VAEILLPGILAIGCKFVDLPFSLFAIVTTEIQDYPPLIKGKLLVEQGSDCTVNVED